MVNCTCCYGLYRFFDYLCFAFLQFFLQLWRCVLQSIFNYKFMIVIVCSWRLLASQQREGTWCLPKCVLIEGVAFVHTWYLSILVHHRIISAWSVSAKISYLLNGPPQLSWTLLLLKLEREPSLPIFAVKYCQRFQYCNWGLPGSGHLLLICIDQVFFSETGPLFILAVQGTYHESEAMAWTCSSQNCTIRVHEKERVPVHAAP